MKKIKIIILYFGKLPNYFTLWEQSALENSNFEFLFFSDSYGIERSQKNINYFKISFMQIKKRFHNVLGERIVLDSPYKLNDYRPTFGKIFSDEIGDADFWGYADIDVVLGKLSHFLTDVDFNKYDKIGDRGHLQFFSNTQKMNTLYLKNNKYGFDFQYASTHKGAYHFDEMWGINGIAKTHEINTKKIESIADISVKKFLFDGDIDTSYYYKKGMLLKENKQNTIGEVSYIHLQKRPMTLLNNITDRNSYRISPAHFLDLSTSFSIDEPNDWPEGHYMHLIKYYQSALKKGEITARVPLLFKKVFNHV